MASLILIIGFSLGLYIPTKHIQHAYNTLGMLA